MKRVIKLNIGGELVAGDVVGISYNNSISFGWFVESGQYGSLKFINMKSLYFINEQYQKFLNGDAINSWYSNKFKKGFGFKTISKDYIISFNATDNRAFKIPNPEEFFKDAGETEIKYQLGKQMLNELKFPAK